MGAGMIIAIVIFVALIGGGIFAYMKKWFWFQKSTGARTYNTVYSSKKLKGACSDGGTGTPGPSSTKSSECAAACDAVKTPSVCNGYDWDGSSGCTLYATLPSKATAPAGKTDKNECRALSSTK